MWQDEVARIKIALQFSSSLRQSPCFRIIVSFTMIGRLEKCTAVQQYEFIFDKKKRVFMRYMVHKDKPFLRLSW